MTGASDNSAAGCVGGVTILRTTGHGLATKTHKWVAALQQWSTISYKAGAWFTAEERPVRSLRELAAVLEEVRRDPRAFIVRGALTPEVRGALKADPEHRIRRRKLKKNNVEPTLLEVPLPWIMVDIDKFQLLASEDLAVDPETAIERAIFDLLPPPFHDAECWWQLSSSAGFAPGVLKAHLFFWLAAPAENDHIRMVLKQRAPGVDASLFHAAQPHYIADPVIENGYDPIPCRTGWRKGLEETVVLPELRPQEKRAGSGPFRLADSVESALALLGDGEGLHGFHIPLRTAAMHYAIQCEQDGWRDDEAFKKKLKEAIEAAPRLNARRSDVDGYLDDNYLRRLVDGAFDLLANDAFEAATPRYQPADLGVDQARAELRLQIRDFLARTYQWHADRRSRLAEAGLVPEPEHAAMVVDVGVGKTRATREALPYYVELMKAASLLHRVIYAVPTHALGRQIVKDMQALGINAALWIGRGGDDPDFLHLPEANRPKMCRTPDLIQEAVAIGHDPEQHVCGTEGGPQCPFRAECAYQRQKAIVGQADVVIVAHEYAFHRLPKAVRDGVGLIIFDESWWQDGLKPNQAVKLPGFAAAPTTWPVLRDRDASRQAGSSGSGKPKRPRKKRTGPLRQIADEAATAELHDLCLKAQRVFEPLAVGEFLAKETVEAARLTAADCERARKLEWRRKRLDVLRPGMALEVRRKALAQAEVNKTLPRRAALWRALQALLEGDEPVSGRLQVDVEADARDGGRVVLLHLRLQVRDWMMELPQLHLDATMPVDIVQHYLPRLAVLANVRAKAPHMAVAQIIGGWGKTSLIPDPQVKPEENARREALLQELRDWVLLHAQGDGLVITYKLIEHYFADLPGIRTLHFNALSGLDSFGQVRTVFVIGRPLPGPEALRDRGLALTGKPVPLEQPVQETRGVLMDDGTGRGLPVRVYADPTLEAIRAAITDAEMVQAVGRVRGVNRGPDNPASVFLFADVILPLPVKVLRRWRQVRLNPVQRMAARGLVLASPRDAALVYPDLFPNEIAARQAMGRARISVTSPYEKILLGECHGNRWKEVSYRPQGKGQQNRAAFVLADRAAGLRAELEAWFGPLALFVITEPEDDCSRQADEPETDAARPADAFEAETPESDLVDRPLPAFADFSAFAMSANGQTKSGPAWRRFFMTDPVVCPGMRSGIDSEPLDEPQDGAIVADDVLDIPHSDEPLFVCIRGGLVPGMRAYMMRVPPVRLPNADALS